MPLWPHLILAGIKSIWNALVSNTYDDVIDAQVTSKRHGQGAQILMLLMRLDMRFIA
jgi:hypothetical protein